MVKLDDELTRYLIGLKAPRTRAALTDRLGISYNTLRKIEAGLPIRPSVAARLRSRLLSEMRHRQQIG